jgi:undecaprenyl diphosphate synthase
MVQNHGIKHLGIIMDGNRRWAKKRGLPALEGHRQGRVIAKKVGEWCIDRGIEVLTLFAFSTENWNRSKKEVQFLFRLLEIMLTKDLDELNRKNIRLTVIGRITGLPNRLQARIEHAVEVTKNNTRGTLQLAVNYGGRGEIVDAVKQLVKEARSASKITEASIGEKLYTSTQPDPDLIIRTSGEQRTSNFLLWQAAYSELYFTKKNWPEFTEKDLDLALQEYKRRERRFGK